MRNNLSSIGKKIVVSMLVDNRISMDVAEKYVENLLIDSDDFTDYNSMYRFIVANYGKLIIE